MNNIINKDIQVGNIEAKMASTGNMKYVITDSEKNKYYFYQKNKGQDCDVYLSFTGMSLKIGDACNIGFTEEQKSFTNQKGENVNYTDRFIWACVKQMEIYRHLHHLNHKRLVACQIQLLRAKEMTTSARD